MAATTGTDRRTEIIRVAYRLIAERGLEGLRFADVARQAGINNGTLLYYFASKDALILAVGGYLVDLFSASVETGDRPAPESDPLAQLRWEFADARARLHSDISVVYTELLARAQRDPAVAIMLREIDAGWRGWLCRILERGKDSGVFRADMNVNLVATAIMAFIRGSGIQALVQGDTTEVEAALEALATGTERWIINAP